MISLKRGGAAPSCAWPIHLAGLLAVAGALVFWGVRLAGLRAAPPVARAPAPVTAPATDADGERIAAWLGPGEVRLNVSVLGLARQGGRAIALLSVNDGPPKPYAAGDTLMRDVTLDAIETDGVTVSRSGKSARLPAPVPPDPLPNGIVRVP
ncbi:type II secretion system protein N [Paludibacterium paludis]|uniref:Type II secretion system protein GspC N-terminal domain-containing protein n=1 Tax=Paludibacterium paludis TaxID=1225769 RepID=A0A918U7R4_9NEIS|nr:type II secretion system protein N [Paludibacterium paludis]GGY04353.1 hypothetical protein GCM10011289_03580 [Paludibacterium paludis]